MVLRITYCYGNIVYIKHITSDNLISDLGHIHLTQLCYALPARHREFNF